MVSFASSEHRLTSLWPSISQPPTVSFAHSVYASGANTHVSELKGTPCIEGAFIQIYADEEHNGSLHHTCSLRRSAVKSLLMAVMKVHRCAGCHSNALKPLPPAELFEKRSCDCAAPVCKKRKKKHWLYMVSGRLVLLIKATSLKVTLDLVWTHSANGFF